MQIQGRVVIVTGGSNGIGRALCHRFAKEGAKAVVVTDIDKDQGAQVAKEIGPASAFIPCNVAKEPEVVALVDAATKKFGQVDIFCSNAGIGVAGGPEAPDTDWQRSWEVNVMAHVYAARAVLPQMLARKEGYLVQTISAAGLLTQIGSAPYAVTKHAGLGFAEWLAITYGDQGIRVSALCPQGVRTGARSRPIELFDLSQDLNEASNVAALNPRIVAKIADIMETARTESKEFPVTERSA